MAAWSIMAYEILLIIVSPDTLPHAGCLAARPRLFGNLLGARLLEGKGLGCELHLESGASMAYQLAKHQILNDSF